MREGYHFRKHAFSAQSASARKGREAHDQKIGYVLAGFSFVDQFSGVIDPRGRRFVRRAWLPARRAKSILPKTA
jgi:hypothetical protein